MFTNYPSRNLYALSDSSHRENIVYNIDHIIDIFPYVIRVLIRPLSRLVINYVLVDISGEGNHNINVAAEALSDGEVISLLRSIGGQ